VQNRLVTVLKRVHDSKEFRDFMAKQGFGVIWAGPQDAAKFMAKSDSDLGAVMKAVGIAK
jgi:tripartite-type tricarboxylate transporter receptor subunit TctC